MEVYSYISPASSSTEKIRNLDIKENAGLGSQFTISLRIFQQADKAVKLEIPLGSLFLPYSFRHQESIRKVGDARCSTQGKKNLAVIFSIATHSRQESSLKDTERIVREYGTRKSRHAEEGTI